MIARRDDGARAHSALEQQTRSRPPARRDRGGREHESRSHETDDFLERREGSVAARGGVAPVAGEGIALLRVDFMSTEFEVRAGLPLITP